MTMLVKLSLRNARRSIRDYLIYLITMSGVAALMFAFDSVIFSKDVAQMCANASVMGVMIGLATVFIMIIVSWLIHYMVRFMLEKRSREFGTYLILGMDQKEIARLYLMENLVMGGFAFLIGIVAGFFLEQGLLVLFYQLFSKEYQIHAGISWLGLFVSVLSFFACYFRTLRKSRKLFQKMTISDFMRMEAENEQIKTGGDRLKQWLVAGGLLLISGSYAAICKLPFSVGSILLFLTMLVTGIYCFYCGLASLLYRYLERRGAGTYRSRNLFILRQLSSKLRTMRFTMGTISVLLCIVILSGSIAMMFAQYQETVVRNVLPFDVIVYNQETDYGFEEERRIVEEDTSILEDHVYQIYYTEDQTMIRYLAEHNKAFGGEYCDENGQLNWELFQKNNWAYYDFDTYMLESDYNVLRKMLGLTPIVLGPEEYAIQAKPRVKTYLEEDFYRNIVSVGDNSLHFSAIYTDDFSQNGHNGADFLVIVPDLVGEDLIPYYSVYAAMLSKDPSDALKQKLSQFVIAQNGGMTEADYTTKMERMMAEGAKAEELEEFEEKEQEIAFEELTLNAIGSDQIISFAGDVMVQKSDRQETMFAVASLIFPLVYISLVFLCVALTILAVQQLSDSGKYRFRYDVLGKLGESEKQIAGIVGKQLLIYYMIPALFAILISSGISILAGNKFVQLTGATGNGLYYFGLSLLLFFGGYVVYYLATYIGFVRNLRK